MSDRQYVRRYRDHQATIRQLSPGTIAQTQALLDRMLKHHPSRTLATITTQDIERWLARGRRGDEASAAPATVQRELSMVRGFFDWLVKVGARADNPAALAASPKVRNRQPKPIPDHDWQMFLSDHLSGDLLTVGLGYYAGLRKSEITALRCAQVDLTNRAFVGFQRKGGGDDTTPYGAMLDVIAAKLPHVWSEWWERYLVDRVRACPDGFVCPWSSGEAAPRDRNRYGLAPGQIPPSRFDYVFGKALPGFTPHQLRHSAATNLLRAGVPLGMVSSLLNHANVQTTMRYCKVAGNDLAEWLTREG